MRVLKSCWHWFWGQSIFNKVALIGLFAAFVPFVLPTIVAWFRPTMIHVGVSFYTYERGVQAQGMNTLYFFERRNLVSDCRIRREEQSVPSGRAKAPDPQSWVLIKLLLENVSDRDMTSLRVGVRSPAINQTTLLLSAPRLVATGNKEAPPDVKPLYVISIETLPAESSAVVTLKTPIDDYLRDFIYVKRRPVTIQVPYVSADQFRQYPPIVSRTNAVKMLNREGVLRTQGEGVTDEKLLVTMVSSEESDREEAEAEASYQALPRAKACSETEAGVW
ncbi:MAG: hypothetical protein OEY60_01955 [Nitrospira sp.]|nr:hypothetical protein [Nitrospira sp.]MDH5497662.1 hypothetical protein [Nitrospira sp.]MDH5724213.1 hypothetical protein [Nitrospira sp.]